MQHNLNLLHKWLHEWGMQAGTAKCGAWSTDEIEL